MWFSVISVPDAETQFNIDEFNDLYARTKPTLYIKMADIFAIHQLVAAETSCMCPSQDDPLREIIRELGSVKNNENELLAVSTSEITLTLSPKLHDVEGMSNSGDKRPKTNRSYRPRCGGESSIYGN